MFHVISHVFDRYKNVGKDVTHSAAMPQVKNCH